MEWDRQVARALYKLWTRLPGNMGLRQPGLWLLQVCLALTERYLARVETNP